MDSWRAHEWFWSLRAETRSKAPTKGPLIYLWHSASRPILVCFYYCTEDGPSMRDLFLCARVFYGACSRFLSRLFAGPEIIRKLGKELCEKSSAEE